MTVDAPPRNRALKYALLLGLMLAVPAVGLPLTLYLIREPAFRSLAELNPAEIRSMELFILQRPDNGYDIGGTRGMFVVPPDKYAEVLATLKDAQPMDASQPRGIWLGRMLVKLHDGRRQTVMFHRPRSDGSPTAFSPLEIRIGRLQFQGPDVNVFTQALDRILGLEIPPREEE